MIRKTIWNVAHGIMSGHKIYAGSGSRITHNIHREDLGIQLIRRGTYGIVNEECVAMFHQEYIVSYERRWPDWETTGDRRKLGKMHFYASGDYHRITEAATMLVLSK